MNGLAERLPILLAAKGEVVIQPEIRVLKRPERDDSRRYRLREDTEHPRDTIYERAVREDDDGAESAVDERDETSRDMSQLCG